MKRIILGLMVIFSLVFVACHKDDDVKFTSVQIKMQMPASLEGKNATMQNTVLTLTNVNSGVETTYNLGSAAIQSFDVEDGLYNILVLGKVQYTTKDAAGEEVSKTETVRASHENVEVVGGMMNMDISLFLFKESSGFVISEIFFAGTRTPANKLYIGDAFIEIYNNTSEVLYADGLCIAETEFLTSIFRYELNPNIKDTHTAVARVYKIPGNGTEHAIQPGKVFLLCDQGIDHRIANPNSFNLSGAMFEWYDEGTKDPDVVEVENLIKIVSNSSSFWVPHNRGFSSYVLFKMDNVTPEQFNNEYVYTYNYKVLSGGIYLPKSSEAWKVPNEDIIDAVECSTPSAFEWKALHASLDLSWTHSGDADNARYGKSVKRKVDRMEGERKILLDTNDSGFDFIPTADPSPGIID